MIERSRVRVPPRVAGELSFSRVNFLCWLFFGLSKVYLHSCLFCHINLAFLLIFRVSGPCYRERVFLLVSTHSERDQWSSSGYTVKLKYRQVNFSLFGRPSHQSQPGHPFDQITIANNPQKQLVGALTLILDKWRHLVEIIMCPVVFSVNWRGGLFGRPPFLCETYSVVFLVRRSL